MAQRRSTALYSIASVANLAGVSRQTMYNWLAANPPLVKHTYDVDGVPVFTRLELDVVRRMALERRALANSLRLSKSAGGR